MDGTRLLLRTPPVAAAASFAACSRLPAVAADTHSWRTGRSVRAPAAAPRESAAPPAAGKPSGERRRAIPVVEGIGLFDEIKGEDEEVAERDKLAILHNYRLAEKKTAVDAAAAAGADSNLVEECLDEASCSRASLQGQHLRDTPRAAPSSGLLRRWRSEGLRQAVAHLMIGNQRRDAAVEDTMWHWQWRPSALRIVRRTSEKKTVPPLLRKPGYQRLRLLWPCSEIAHLELRLCDDALCHGQCHWQPSHDHFPDLAEWLLMLMLPATCHGSRRKGKEAVEDEGEKEKVRLAFYVFE